MKEFQEKFQFDLFRFGKEAFASIDIDGLLPMILPWVLGNTQAQRCGLVLYGKDGNPAFEKWQKERRDQFNALDKKISQEIEAWVKTNKKTFLTQNALQEKRLKHKSDDTLIRQNLLSAVCAPLKDKDEVFGVVYIDHRAEEAKFNNDTKQLLEALASLMAQGLKKSLESTLRQRQKNARLRNLAVGYDELIGKSPAIQKVRHVIDKIKDLDVNVLLSGETGTGKGLVAHLLHSESIRNGKEIVCIDCRLYNDERLTSEIFGHALGAYTGAIKDKPGRIDDAEGGILFLDEIENLTATAQERLLHFIDHKTYTRVGENKQRKVDARLVFATNMNLANLVKEGKFRDDLYARITKGVELEVPPLRALGDDILLMAEKYVKEYNKKFKKNVLHISAESRQYLLAYSYPTNVRELEKFILRAVLEAEGDTLYPEHFPKELLENAHPPNRDTDKASIKLLQTSEDNIYAQYLPEDDKHKVFIYGADAEQAAANKASNVKQDPQRDMHGTILVSMKQALAFPLKIAKEAVISAFERNYVIGQFIQTNGAIGDAAQLSDVNRSTMSDLADKHGIQAGWYKK